MGKVYSIFGMICLVELSLGFLAIAIAILLDKLKTLSNNYIDKQLGLITQHNGNRISGYAYWFSENELVQSAFDILGKYMARDGDINIDVIRDEWRRNKNLKS